MLHLKKKEWFFLLAGTALMAVGAEGFFEHADLVAGGITGIGIMLDAWTMELRSNRLKSCFASIRYMVGGAQKVVI